MEEIEDADQSSRGILSISPVCGGGGGADWAAGGHWHLQTTVREAGPQAPRVRTKTDAPNSSFFMGISFLRNVSKAA